MIDLHNGDCLEVMDKLIEQGVKVDAIICDPPYGTVKGAELDGWGNGKTDWDTIIDHKQMLEKCNKLLRMNGCLVLFSQDPYTSKLATETHGNLPFSYRMTWLKDHFANALIAKKAPVNYTEDINVFFKTQCIDAINPLKDIMKKYATKYGEEYIIKLFIEEGRYTSILSSRVHSSYKFGFNNGARFDLMNKSLFDFMSKHIEFEESYEEMTDINEKFKKVYKKTFNLPQGKKYKSNVFEYKKDYTGFHPTQKPVALMEDLVKTYTNEGNLVLDFTMGSGTTGVACKNLNRNFIGIELDENYFNIAKERINGQLI